MSIFDKLKSTAQQAATSAIQSIGNKREVHLISFLYSTEINCFLSRLLTRPVS